MIRPSVWLIFFASICALIASIIYSDMHPAAKTVELLLVALVVVVTIKLSQ